MDSSSTLVLTKSTLQQQNQVPKQGTLSSANSASHICSMPTKYLDRRMNRSLSKQSLNSSLNSNSYRPLPSRSSSKTYTIPKQPVSRSLLSLKKRGPSQT